MKGLEIGRVLSCLISLTWPCASSESSWSSNLGFLNDESSEEHFGQNATEAGLSPPVGNLAANAIITTNATCGQMEPETFCKLVEHVNSRARLTQCQICDAHSPDRSKRHPIAYAIDGSDRWWQSPSLQNGRKYEWVTITIDLKQAYQVAYIVIKAALSPRPGNWILEKSLDGLHFFPWQYFAVNDEECVLRYGIPARPGKPSYTEDDEVICTSYFSKISPFEGGEIHTSLVNGRPGATGPTEKLVKFTIARYVRLRLQKVRTLHADLMGVGGNHWDKSVMRRYFYSIKDISIGGHCVCFGHSSDCVRQGRHNAEKCMCKHNTCGENCDMCCPLFNQYEWGPGNSTASAACEKCQCYGHAQECVYDPVVHEQKKSINIFGTYSGGGVCLGCKAHTTGINCEQCETGYYRPVGVDLNDFAPCVLCDCSSSPGSTGTCATHEYMNALGEERKNVGDCHCRPGYAGIFCQECTLGFQGFPNCVPCPCNLSGIVNMDCEGDCICKVNVEGQYCSNCKSGYFNLDKSNPDGCTQCFCHGVTSECRTSNFSVIKVLSSESDKWVITDLNGTKVTIPLQVGNTLHAANEEFAMFDKYYWSSPEYFVILNIDSYGLDLSFRMSWVTARGDTSGKPIFDHGVIIQGKNSVLAFSHNLFDGNNVTIRVSLNEHSCVILDVALSAGNYPPCSRYDVMETLSDVKQVFLRAKFHTDQIEGMLHDVALEKADVMSLGTGRKATSIEICKCPSGYTGYSCQDCDYGYRKSTLDSWLNECIKCACNGHARGCGLDGTCLSCEHNTTGVHCETCIEGQYGNPSNQLSTTCKPCACPLLENTNNFSPTCIVDGYSYVCTDCQLGYTGPFCERCASGFFGNPSQVGDSCKPCNCVTTQTTLDEDGEICDRLTGECFVCPQNTTGWHCDECRLGFYGNPLNGSCLPCDCSPFGAIGIDCDDMGQCECSERFAGKTCDTCIPGCGNVEQGCLACNCDPTGSVMLTCDTVTGQCPCKPGVTGRYCNQCLEFHYGFSLEGCLDCDCHVNGSDSQFCDLLTGDCHCLRNVQHRNCNGCEVGYWNLDSGDGCEPCGCDPIGAFAVACDVAIGQCHCKPGVMGRQCALCAEKHYGFSSTGCKACDPCEKGGHICDGESGRCVCPPNVEGTNCSTCAVGYWGNPVTGCKPCMCSAHGSVSLQCSAETGRCSCLAGFDGDMCDFCQFGYYNYPQCISCGCDVNGTSETYCNEGGACSCDSYGQCPCKKNVIGPTCNKCKDGAFGLSRENPEGCIDCFCFQRTIKCSEGIFKWQRLGLLSSQTLSVSRLVTSAESHPYFLYSDGQEHCYVYLALPHQREVVPSWRSRLRLNILNNLVVIPESGTDVLIEKGVSFSAPLYWQLPQIFLGDKVLSYNGFLRFYTLSEAAGMPFPHDVLSSYPLVQIQGNHRLILEHYPRYFSQTGSYEVRFNGDSWRLKHGPMEGLVTKEIMMVTLQNLQTILIRGTNAPEILKATIFNVSVDMAVHATPTTEGPPARGIEVCDCPAEYNSTSCQNPKAGYFRWYKKEFITSTVIIDLIGEARPCQCNRRSSVCDTETGLCKNCSDNTGGPYCEQCALGFYGNPETTCLPCPCPTVWHRHANSCMEIRPGNFQCLCREGYTGKSCERCDFGYFGNPNTVGGSCELCLCNPHGSVSDECHEVTGQCNCKISISGRDCSKCSARDIIVDKYCVSCDGPCTGLLFNDLDLIEGYLRNSSFTADETTVWQALYLMQLEYQQLASNVSVFQFLQDQSLFLDNIPTHDTLATIVRARANELETASESLSSDASTQRLGSEDLLQVINFLKTETHGTILSLKNYVTYGNGLGNVSSAVEILRLILDTMRQIRIVESEQAANASSELTLASEAYKGAFTAVFQKNASAVDILNARTRLDDLQQQISDALKNRGQAEKIVAASRLLLGTGKANAAAIEDMVLGMDMDNMLALDILGRGAYVTTEINDVLLTSEFMMRELKDLSKTLRIRENNLFEQVPFYKVNFAEPAFVRLEAIQKQSAEIQRSLHFATSNTSKAHQAITAFERIREGFVTVLEIAKNAANISKETSIRVQTLLRQFPPAEIKQDSSALLENGLTLQDILDKSFRERLTERKESLANMKWRLRSANESIQMLVSELQMVHESRRDLDIPSLFAQVDDAFEFWDETQKNLEDAEADIQTNLQDRLDQLKLRAAFNSTQVDAMMDVLSRDINTGRLKTMDVNVIKVRKEATLEAGAGKIKYLKSLIAQAKHKADTVAVSIGPDETGTCFRLYKWPVLGGATTVAFNFAPVKPFNSLLFYWPSSITDDFLAIEMVDRKIKASWDLGSGPKILTYPLLLAIDREGDPDDPDFWYHILYTRVGSSVSLAVQLLDPTGGTTLSPKVNYADPDENSTVMNLAPSDLIHVGGISKLRRPGLVSNGLSGCIHNLRVNHNTVGLWNFVGNEGCAACTQCAESDFDAQNLERDYYFDGRGYSIVKRIQSQAFYSKSFDVNMEIRTYAENGLIFLTSNEAVGQSISLEMVAGQMVFKVRHGRNPSGTNSIHLETTGDKLNTGQWIKIEALWVYQKFLQTGQLTVLEKQYTQQLESSDLSLDLYNAPYQIGGRSPAFFSSKWEGVSNISFVGCVKNLLIDGNAYDPLSHQYFGVETPCGGKKIHVTSFEGNGYAEYGLWPFGKQFELGFSFRTTFPTGLILLSTFGQKGNASTEALYYAVYLENGEINVQLYLVNEGVVQIYDKHETRYDDGKIHDFRLVIKQKKFTLFMDDENVGRENAHLKSLYLPPSSLTAFYVGGASLSAQEEFRKLLTQVDKGFAGCLENLYFDNAVLNFNHPLSHQNQNLGNCPTHFSSFSLQFVPQYFSSRIQHIQAIPEEERCSSVLNPFGHDDLNKALHFGDSPDSYVAIPLDPSNNLRQQFNLTFHFRTFYPNGLLFQGIKKKGEEEYHILSYLKDGQLLFKFANRLWSQELVSSQSQLNDGTWHIVSIVKADEKVFLYIDSTIASEARVLKRMKQINKLYLGGIPAGGSDFLENSVQKPDNFKGCLRKIVVNSHEYVFNATSVVRYQVNPCFLNVESGTFFGGDSYVIYMYNFTFNSPVELELEFRTNSKSGDLLTFVPDFGFQSPSFSIYLKDGEVFASEASSVAGEVKAVESFSNPDYLCDGQWHLVKANFIGRSISLKVDTFPNVDSLMDSTSRIGGSWRQATGTLFVGGHDGRGHLKRPGFHGCIKNLSINQNRKDWSDMALLSKVFLNSCPV